MLKTTLPTLLRGMEVRRQGKAKQGGKEEKRKRAKEESTLEASCASFSTDLRLQSSVFEYSSLTASTTAISPSVA